MATLFRNVCAFSSEIFAWSLNMLSTIDSPGYQYGNSTQAIQFDQESLYINGQRYYCILEAPRKDYSDVVVIEYFCTAVNSIRLGFLSLSYGV
jgi:hypothetical protein